MPNWLEAVLIRAKDARWCTQPYCTTCGSMEFRRAYWAAAARQAGIPGPFGGARFPRDLFEGVSIAEHEVLVRTMVAGLRELSAERCGSAAFRTMIIDLDPPLLRHGVPMALDTVLSGTPAGKALAGMRAHSQELIDRQKRREAFESPEAIEERYRVRREESAIAQARRQSETRRRTAERKSLLAALASLSPAGRLTRLATDPKLNLDHVSPELIPVQQSDLIGLDKALVGELIARIGRRRGPWADLRRILERL